MSNISLPNPHKRGDTFRCSAQLPIEIQSEDMKCQIRDASGRLVSDVTIIPTSDPMLFELVVKDTKHWPIGTIYADIECVINGDIKSSEGLIEITVVRDVTQ
jgi:hypothetical protein